MLLKTALARAPLGARAFASSAMPRSNEIIMNRYSRTITQPKAQGASQVSRTDSTTLMTRPCCTLPMVLPTSRILTRPWSVSPVFGTRETHVTAICLVSASESKSPSWTPVSPDISSALSVSLMESVWVPQEVGHSLAALNMC
jgi:hypothetical protein